MCSIDKFVFMSNYNFFKFLQKRNTFNTAVTDRRSDIFENNFVSNLQNILENEYW